MVTSEKVDKVLYKKYISLKLKSMIKLACKDSYVIHRYSQHMYIQDDMYKANFTAKMPNTVPPKWRWYPCVEIYAIMKWTDG